MPKMVFINLPVRDLPAATAFYEALGFVKHPGFSDDNASSMQWSDTIVFMLLKREFYSTFTSKPIADAHRESAHLISLNFDSREAVDAIVEKARAAGGRIDASPPQDHGFMYARDFEDLDGNGFGPLWMDPKAIPPQP
ncbi:MAG: VOC family protein [Caulobacteraceae bacterium]|nr:VOC family protein [Caulobacteraceae bacterium]